MLFFLISRKIPVVDNRFVVDNKLNFVQHLNPVKSPNPWEQCGNGRFFFLTQSKKKSSFFPSTPIDSYGVEVPGHTRFSKISKLLSIQNRCFKRFNSINPFMPTVPTFAVRETDVSRTANVGTMGMNGLITKMS